MQKQAPTLGRIAIAVGFAMSCFGLLLFLWVAFGGPVPLKPKDYSVTVEFDEATQLAVESDIRISGVSVGKVKEIELSDDGLAEATLQIESRFAPIPVDSKATLRQKTLLGETYVELTPGDATGPSLPEEGSIPRAQVAESVQLDEIFRAFDPKTRVAFRDWMQNAAVAFRGRGEDLNAALGNLTPFAARADDLLRTLDGQSNAVGQLIRDGGATFDALSEREGALRGLITNSETVFSTTARRDEQLRQTFQILPTFLRESRQTLVRLDEFSGDTNPLITQLRPSIRELSGTLVALETLAPRLERFFDGLQVVNRRAPAGFGALQTLLDDDLPPVLTRVTPFMDELVPVVQALRAYRREVTSFLANTSSALNAFNVDVSQGKQVKYFRSTAPLSPEAIASYGGRLTTNRNNPYVRPGGYSQLDQTLDSLITQHCDGSGGGLNAILDPASADDLPEGLFDRIQLYAFGGEQSSDQIPAPPCDQAAPQPSIGGEPSERTIFPHVNDLP